MKEAKRPKINLKVLPFEIILLYFIFLLLLCGTSIYFILHNSKLADKTYGELVSKYIYEYKKDNLEYTVENAIKSFDQMKKNVESQLAAEQLFYLEKISEFVRYFQTNERILSGIESMLLPDHLFLKVTNTATNNILVSTYPIYTPKGEFYYKKIVKVEPYLLEIAYNHSFLYERVLSLVSTYIHSQTFSNDSYIWINEVINWDGGDDYAIRLVHPNLVQTEGSLLSTNTQDIVGNFPYLEELNEIKKRASFFNTYYFERKNTGEIAEKLAYASLYPEFNWIVAMGVHIEDVDFHVDYISRESKEYAKAQVVKTIFILVVLFLCVLFLLTIASSYYISRTKKRIAKESNLDFLTNIYNRKIADEHLLMAFFDYKKTGQNYFVFLIDIDDFKSVNDTYGHVAGDFVLKRIVEIIQEETRASDAFFRWGGEEFVLACKNIEVHEIASFAQRIIDKVKNTPITITNMRKKRLKFLDSRYVQEKNESFESKGIELSAETAITLFVTISAGLSCFAPEDTSYLECFRRMDIALYESKTTGKNKYTILY